MAMVAAALGVLVIVGLVVWAVVADRRRREQTRKDLQQLGFSPSPEDAERVRGIVTAVENNRGSEFQVTAPARLRVMGGKYLYYYQRRRTRLDESSTEEQVLLPLLRPSKAGLVLVVKPSSLPTGLVTRVIGAIAGGDWDAQPDDLKKIELPRDLEGTNVVAALGPPGATLYGLIDARTLTVVQSLGDAGALLVRFRDESCTLGGASAHMPFKLDQVVARLRPLL